jgi:hypothetical protein
MGEAMDAKLKHLEFIQSAIGRMATSSFLFKGWSVTVAAGLSAFAAGASRPGLLFVALLSTALFWGLDGYYLWLERGFVKLHYRVAATQEADIDFSMAVDKTNAAAQWLKTCLSRHLIAFYGMILAIDIVGIAILKGGK